jgi:Rad17 P-loop domain
LYITPLFIKMDDPMIVDVLNDGVAPSLSDPNKENAALRCGTLQYAVPWVEKYRPRTLQEVLGNEETIVRLRAIAKDGNLPNLIVCGPPGTGKTTSVHALARELLGSAYKDAVLELNASDARGIDVRFRCCLPLELHVDRLSPSNMDCFLSM